MQPCDLARDLRLAPEGDGALADAGIRGASDRSESAGPASSDTSVDASPRASVSGEHLAVLRPVVVAARKFFMSPIIPRMGFDY